MSGRECTKREVSETDLKAFISGIPDVRFDGFRYTTPIVMRGGTWKKTVAYVEAGKYFVIEDK